jgi:DNA-binding beta-propeller fold protein YncE
MPLRDRAALARVDARTMRLAATVPLEANCRKPSALELDNADRRIYVGCRGDEQTAPRMLVIDADSTRTVASVPIGRGVDEVMYDARRRQIMTANGEDGSLSVISKQSADRYQLLETIGTRPLARTGVLDERSGKIYLVNAQYVKVAGASDEDSLHFVPNTFTVLTYAR